jgi:hypothetical protein
MNNPPPGSYCTDMAAEIDTPQETLADELGIPLKAAGLVMAYVDTEVRKSQALILARVIGLLLKASNLPAMAHAIAFASGLDQLNGAKSQAEVARELGVTRALLSHYTLGVRDVLSGKDSAFECTKFRKSQASRATFKAKATNPFTAAKAAAVQRYKASTKLTKKCNS